MLKVNKKKLFMHPIKLVLSEMGVNIFVRNSKKLDKINLPNGKLYYGIRLSEFSFPTLQKLIENNCVNKIELSVLDYDVNRFEILDITKLLIFNLFYRKFNYEVVSLFTESSVINELFQLRLYKSKSFIDSILPKDVVDTYWYGSKSKSDMEDEILAPINKLIYNDTKLTDQEKNMKTLLGRKFLSTIKNSTWLMLSISQKTHGYNLFISRISNFLYKYISHSSLPDYVGESLLKIIGVRNELALLDYYNSPLNTIKDTYENIMSTEELRQIFLAGAIDSVNNVSIVFNLDDNSDIKKDQLSFFFSCEVFCSLSDIDDNSRLLVNLLENYYIEDARLHDFEQNVLSKISPNLRPIYYLVFLQKFCKTLGVSFYPSIYRSSDKKHGVFKLKVQI